METKTKVILIFVVFLSIIGAFSMTLFEETADEVANVEQSTFRDVEEAAPKINAYDVQWSDNFNGYETSITKIETEGKEMRVYFSIYNGSDATYLNNVEWGYAVINQKQIDANMFGSGDIGGEHLSDTKHEDFVAYYVDSEADLADMSELRLLWDLTNNSTFETKQYDIVLPLN